MDDERFIEEVQFRSVLYDTTHPFYKDNSRKERAWAEVATALRTDVCDCKSRWRNLRDTFVKHRKRLEVPKGNWPQKDWKYSELMSFLLPFVVPRASKRKAPPPAELEGEGSSAPLSPAPSTPPAPPPPQSAQREHTGREGGGSRGSWAECRGLWAERRESWAERRPRVPESDWDEAYHFCLSVVPQLLRLDWRRRHTAKIEILRVLERLRQDQDHDKTPPGPRTHTQVGDRAGPRGPGSDSDQHQRRAESYQHQRRSESDQHQRRAESDQHQRRSESDQHQRRAESDQHQRRSESDQHQRRSESDQYQQLFLELFQEDGSFVRLVGLSRGQFEELLRLVGESLTLQDTNYRRSIPASLRLCIGLRYLRSGEHFHSVAEMFRVALSSVCKIVPQVVAALWDGLKGEVLAPPGLERWRSVSEEFRRRFDFPLCCGALDGRQVLLKAPPRSGVQGQRSSSVVLLAVVDARSRFLVVEVGGFGRVSDEGILESSVFGQALSQGKLDLPPPAPLPGAELRGPQPYVFVSDETFTLRTNVMRPFTGHFVAPQKRVFNQRLARAQRAADRAFARLASHWGLYRRPAETRPEVAEQCVRATCLLHNLILSEEEGPDEEGEGPEEEGEGPEEEGPVAKGAEPVGEGSVGVEPLWEGPQGEEVRMEAGLEEAEPEWGEPVEDDMAEEDEAPEGDAESGGGASGDGGGVSDDEVNRGVTWRLRRLERGWAHRPTNEAMRVRDVFMEHFSAEGAAPWQNAE